ncbi:MAG: hypothetical protein AAF602_27750, partial [Myxococcota bacterium]
MNALSVAVMLSIACDEPPTPIPSSPVAEGPVRTTFGDLDRDGTDDVVQFAGARIFGSAIDADRSGILADYLDVDIRHLVVGRFAPFGPDDGRDQIVAFTEDDRATVLGVTDDTRGLERRYSQAAFVADGEATLVGDFDGDGVEELLVADTTSGEVRLFRQMAQQPSRTLFFEQAPDFAAGDLAPGLVVDRVLRAGDLRGEADRSDVLTLDPATGAVALLRTRTDTQGRTTFELAFDGPPGTLPPGSGVDVGQLDDGPSDEILVSTPSGYLAFHAEVDPTSATGLLVHQTPNLPLFDDYPGGAPFFADSYFGRDLLVLHQSGSDAWAVFDTDAQQLLHVTPVPELHIGWPARRDQPWLVLKCGVDGGDRGPHDDAFYRDLFTEDGDATRGLSRYLREQSLGAFTLRATLDDAWVDVGVTRDEVDRNGGTFHMWGPLPEGDEAYYDWSFELVSADRVRLWHRFTGKYLTSAHTTPGGEMHAWFPMPPGDAAFYTFQLIARTDGSFRLRHEASGMFVTAEPTNLGRVLLAESPDPDDDAFAFWVRPSTRRATDWTLQQVSSGKFLTGNDTAMGPAELGPLCLDAANLDEEDYVGVIVIYDAEQIVQARSGRFIALRAAGI